MKKLFGKSFLALVLAMTMLMGMSMTVMAKPADPPETISCDAGHQVHVKIIGESKDEHQNDVYDTWLYYNNEFVSTSNIMKTTTLEKNKWYYDAGGSWVECPNLNPSAPAAPGTCPDCKGQGKIKCAEPNCEDGKIKCDRCNGRGEYMCTNPGHPFGYGLSCPDCGAQVSPYSVTCKKCLGAKTEDCPACKGGYNTCKTCGGTGSIGGDSYSTPSAPTIPTDYVAERVAEEEAMEVSPVTVDTAQYGAGEATVVPATSYNLSKFVTTKGIVKGINTAVAAANNNKKDVAEIYTGKPFCFNKEIIKAIQEGNKTVVYYFAHEGHIYSVTVPATVDAAKVLEQAGFAGPLYVGQQLGTTRLIK